MKEFIGDDFLLNNKTAVSLYKTAKTLPIYDYHCHLSPREIAEDKVFYDIGELMLSGDHYKWRIMRQCGIDEDLITGKASYKEKFIAYAKALSLSVGNPLYHWTHMELKTYFGISEPFNEKNAAGIYEKANKIMADGSFSARKLIEKSNVQIIATTDDPADNLEWHKKIRDMKDFKTKVVPTFRPDLACNMLKDGFLGYLMRLGESAGIEINSLSNLIYALIIRLDFFSDMGCRIADHGIENIPIHEADFDEAKAIFEKALNGSPISQTEAEKYLFYMLFFFACEYQKRGWAMQIHMSVLRNQNTKLYNKLGADCGIDSVGDTVCAKSLGRLFDTIETAGGMPKTILYSLNPASNYILATMLGNFAGGPAGKMQLGAAWWFCDHRDGIKEQLKLIANTGVLGQFVGMLTDSRSFTSYVRHDYFRRILCSLIGEWAENGEIALEGLEDIIKGICFRNANKYFE